MKKLDSSVIPFGDFCYRVVKLAEGEILSNNREQYGKDLREFSYHAGYKCVLCPYWQRTNYATVRCDFLDEEYIDYDSYDYDVANEMIINHFDDPEAVNKFQYHWSIPDEIKICGENLDNEDEQEESN